MKSTLLILVGAFCWAEVSLAADPSHVVDINKVITDSACKGLVQHHRYIKSFLALPQEVRSEVQPVLLLLLKSGYGLEDLTTTYAALHVPTGVPINEPAVFDQMAKSGASKAEIQAAFDRFLRDSKRIRERIVRMLTGVDDPILLNELIQLGPDPTTVVRMPVLPLLEAAAGETLLTDDDWMNEDYRQAFSSFNGERRHMAPKKLRPSDSITEMTPTLRPLR